MPTNTFFATTLHFVTNCLPPRSPLSSSSSSSSSDHPCPSTTINTIITTQPAQQTMSILSLNKPLPVRPIQYYPPRLDSLPEHPRCYQGEQVYFADKPVQVGRDSVSGRTYYGKRKFKGGEEEVWDEVSMPEVHVETKEEKGKRDGEEHARRLVEEKWFRWKVKGETKEKREEMEDVESVFFTAKERPVKELAP